MNKNTLKYLIALIFAVLTQSISYAQDCQRSGEFTGGSVKGGVKLKVTKKGKMFIQLDGEFESKEGPDLNIYLSNTSQVQDESLLVHRLDGLVAAQRYKLTSTIDIEKYTYVIIHCTEYNHHFGTATLGEMTGEGCPTN